MRILERTCAVCGRKLEIEIDENGKILRGGHYFGKIDIPDEGAEVVHKGKTRIGDLELEVVDYTRKKEVEYWECDECYNSAEEN